jgi:four helix bundle protein
LLIVDCGLWIGDTMTPDELKKRTKQFALRVIQICDALPNSRAGNVIAGQLIRSATSVGANYRAVCRARSTPDFVAKLGITLEETDESIYWLELITESGMSHDSRVSALMKEGNELAAIFNASKYTARARISKPPTIKNQ